MEHICSDLGGKGTQAPALFPWPGCHQATLLHGSTTLSPNKAPQTWKNQFPSAGWDTHDTSVGQSPRPQPLSLPKPAMADAQITLNAQQEPGCLQREAKWHFSAETPKLQPPTSSTDHPRPLFPSNPIFFNSFAA